MTLTKQQIKLLTDAAGRYDAQLILPDSVSDMAGAKLTMKLGDLALIVEREVEGETSWHLTDAGYRAVGLEPPRPAGRTTKRERVIALLRRDEGATVPELMTETGWLAHTTRAVLSRLRSAGETLIKTPRQDGTTAYSMPAPTLAGDGRRTPAVTEQAAAA